ncbi:MAG: hypothetical protein JWP30_495 [Homoserinimonas sp.]|jgi:hypothetical protein|nr:hypothetical protein [Homoserinimonas sp.]
MPYTADKPTRAKPSDELRALIPGWGADLDPQNRPSIPQEQFDPTLSGAHWVFPERQEAKGPRERSMEHAFLTPVFGTSSPLHGISGVMRRYSYKKYSEGRAAHWLILLAADRIDVAESRLRSMFTARPDNPIAETGIRSEFTHHGISSRVQRKRADLSHVWIDPFIVAGPWLLVGALTFGVLRALATRQRS